ncbi:Mitochondrial porin [Fusarium torreyae]|uniref:Mitochondrial porin n=1 Tax=Fusarium torreyae TaxID=1237075 RepID=A0A9W8S5Q2_9HYPO|nr:Mitochondrial porin [Fusarium torreyae]
MSVPAFSDIAKPANDLLNKDFYHLSATTFEFKDTAPNGVAFKVTGKSSHEKATSAAAIPASGVRKLYSANCGFLPSPAHLPSASTRGYQPRYASMPAILIQIADLSPLGPID